MTDDALEALHAHARERILRRLAVSAFERWAEAAIEIAPARDHAVREQALVARGFDRADEEEDVGRERAPPVEHLEDRPKPGGLVAVEQTGDHADAGPITTGYANGGRAI